MRKQLTVFVTNNGLDVFTDRYDGEDFAIAPGETLEMEAACARLVFGFGDADKARAIRRKGWAPTAEDMPMALERLGDFSFNESDPSLSCLHAPASGKGAAGESRDDPAATGHDGTAHTASMAGVVDEDVSVQPTVRPPKGPTNALANIARVVNVAPG